MTAMKEQPSARQIYGTIGPACADVKTLEAMFRAGMGRRIGGADDAE